MLVGAFVWVLAASTVLVASAAEEAAFAVSNIYGDHMVVQRGKPIRVTGRGPVGQEVVCAVHGETNRVVTIGADGRWLVEFPPRSAGFIPMMSFGLKSNVQMVMLRDVAVGDVWLALGQSNMEFRMRSTPEWKEILPTLADMRIRGIRAPRGADERTPWRDLAGRPSWFVATADEKDELSNFTAVGFFFAQELRQALKAKGEDVPVGIICSNWGGTPIQVWTPVEGGKYWNAMIAPFTQMNVRGVLWYQGCANAGDPDGYRRMQKEFAFSCRREWRDAHLPFIVTELASYGEHRPENPLAEDRWSTFDPNDGYRATGYAPFRQMQSEFATLPDTGCAPNFDLGEQYDIHPKRKRPIAKRLVAEALRLSYGETGREPAPRFRSAARDGSSVLVSFDFVGKGLAADGGAFNAHLWALADATGHWAWAEAELLPDSRVRVTAKGIEKPVSVQYGYMAYHPAPNFRRKGDGFPVFGFRHSVTDADSQSSTSSLQPSTSRYSSFRPGQVWLDTEGKPIQAHAGSILKIGDTYWWYGENKERTDGKSEIWHWGVRAYTSKDLYNWRDEGLIIPPETNDEASPLHPHAYMDRPHILYNEKTKKFVCWLKIMQAPEQSKTILTADSIRGPWTKVRTRLHPCGMDAGDFDLVKAADGKAYYYFERPHTELIAAELADDYTDANGVFKSYFPLMRPPFTREAPSYFFRKGKHYLLTSGTTGYWPNPSEFAVAKDYLGPWERIGDACPTDKSDTSFHAQFGSVYKVPGKKDLYIALGDRWIPSQMSLPYAVVSNAFDKATSNRGSDADCQRFWKTYAASKTPPTKDATYVWLPIVFKDGKPEIVWRDEWRLENFE